MRTKILVNGFYYTSKTLLKQFPVDIIPGIDPESHRSDDLTQPRRRDPDALPPSNAFEAIGSIFHHSVGALGHGNAIFGFKAGLLTSKRFRSYSSKMILD